MQRKMVTMKYIVMVLCMGLFIFGTAFAQNTKTTDNEKQSVVNNSMTTIETLDKINASLTGVVLEETTGNPLEGVTVLINFMSQNPYSNNVTEKEDNYRVFTTTDVNGHYVLKNIPPGKYKVKFTKNGYKGVLWPETRGEFVSFTAGQTVMLPDPQVKEMSFSMTPQTMVQKIVNGTGFAVMFVGDNWKSLIMIAIAFIFIFLAIAKDYEPLLLLPIGFGILIGNLPYPISMPLGVYDIISYTGSSQNSVFGLLYYGVTNGIFPPLIFLGIGAMTDFSALISSPKSVLLGAAAQLGIFATFVGALALGFTNMEAASIGIIGGADGPTSIFVTSMLAPHLLGPVAIAAYSYMGLVPVIQPPFMKLLITKKEAMIRMAPSRRVSKVERVFFPITVFIICALVAPGSITLVGMLMLGNLMKESGVVDRLAKTASGPLMDMAVIILGFTVGASTQAAVFLTSNSVKIFVLGCLSFCVATIGGLLFAKLMNVFLKIFKQPLINPLIGSAGVSAVPDSARVSQIYARKFDPGNHILMHAMGPNVAGVIGSAVAAGVFISVMF